MQLHGVAVRASDVTRITTPKMSCDRPLPRSEGIDEDRLKAVPVLLSHNDVIRSEVEGSPGRRKRQPSDPTLRVHSLPDPASRRPGVGLLKPQCACVPDSKLPEDRIRRMPGRLSQKSAKESTEARIRANWRNPILAPGHQRVLEHCPVFGSDFSKAALRMHGPNRSTRCVDDSELSAVRGTDDDRLRPCGDQRARPERNRRRNRYAVRKDEPITLSRSRKLCDSVERVIDYEPQRIPAKPRAATRQVVDRLKRKRPWDSTVLHRPHWIAGKPIGPDPGQSMRLLDLQVGVEDGHTRSSAIEDVYRTVDGRSQADRKRELPRTPAPSPGACHEGTGWVVDPDLLRPCIEEYETAVREQLRIQDPIEL